MPPSFEPSPPSVVPCLSSRSFAPPPHTGQPAERGRRIVAPIYSFTSAPGSLDPHAYENRQPAVGFFWSANTHIAASRPFSVRIHNPRGTPDHLPTESRLGLCVSPSKPTVHTTTSPASLEVDTGRLLPVVSVHFRALVPARSNDNAGSKGNARTIIIALPKRYAKSAPVCGLSFIPPCYLSFAFLPVRKEPAPRAWTRCVPKG